MSLRILHIVDSLERTGTAGQLALVARGLPRPEFEAHVAALRCADPIGNELTAAGISVTSVGRRRPVDPQAFGRLRRLIASYRPDIVHTWDEVSLRYGCLAGWLAGVRRWIVALGDLGDPPPWLTKQLDRQLGRRTSAFVVETPAVAEKLRAYVPADRTHTIYPGVPSAQPSTVSRAALLAELGLPENIYLAAAIGRLEPHQRLKDVIWAADLLKVIRDDVHLLVIGEGSHRGRLEIFREQVRIRDKVHFLGARDDVARILPHCNWLWHGGEREALPQSILEAMAAGVPVVATNIASHRELVVEGQTGYLVPVGDRAALARAANRILNDPALAQRLGGAARERAWQLFGVDRMLGQFAALYRQD